MSKLRHYRTLTVVDRSESQLYTRPQVSIDCKFKTEEVHMYFVIFGTDKPGKGQQRRDSLHDVASYIKEHPGHPDVTVHCGGPTVDKDGIISGTLMIIEAPSIEEVQAYFTDSPIRKMDFNEEYSIRRFDWKTGRPD